jgi:hypothetical protein
MTSYHFCEWSISEQSSNNWSVSLGGYGETAAWSIYQCNVTYKDGKYIISDEDGPY